LRPKVFMAHVEGYTPLEPHGYLTGDYPHGRVVTEDRVRPGLAWRRGLCGFRLWRTRPGHGKPDAGVCVVLCCKAVVLPRTRPPTHAGPSTGSGDYRTAQQTGASRTQQPEARDEEGDVTGAIAPTKPLTALDLCDRCGAQAYVRVLLPNSGELLFCAHHSREHLPALKKVAIDIQDETQRLSKPEN